MSRVFFAIACSICCFTSTARAEFLEDHAQHTFEEVTRPSGEFVTPAPATRPPAEKPIPKVRFYGAQSGQSNYRPSESEALARRLANLTWEKKQKAVLLDSPELLGKAFRQTERLNEHWESLGRILPAPRPRTGNYYAYSVTVEDLKEMLHRAPLLPEELRFTDNEIRHLERSVDFALEKETR